MLCELKTKTPKTKNSHLNIDINLKQILKICG